MNFGWVEQQEYTVAADSSAVWLIDCRCQARGRHSAPLSDPTAAFPADLQSMQNFSQASGIHTLYPLQPRGKNKKPNQPLKPEQFTTLSRAARSCFRPGGPPRHAALRVIAP